MDRSARGKDKEIDGLIDEEIKGQDGRESKEGKE